MKAIDWPTAIRQLRAEMSLTQRALADLLKVTVVTIQNYEAGRYRPDPIVLKRMVAIAPEHWQGRLDRELPPELQRGGPARRVSAKKQSRRYSEETREMLIAALDTILERAPSTIVEQVTEFLTSRAGKYGEPK